MHLLNKADNDLRTNYYGCNAVPWIEINGVNVATNQTAFMNAVNSGNAEYSPFKIVLTPERLPNDVIDVKVKILRDISDMTTFDNPKLRVSLTEKVVEILSNPCCNNGETDFYSINRKMLPNAHGISFEIPAPGDSVELSLSYIPSADFLQEVNLDSIRVVAFIQDHCSQEMYQSVMADIIYTDRVNAAFTADETLGASPLMVTFSDYSSATTSTSISTWEWDFNNDGTIDSYDQNPVWNFTDEQSYTISLTVSDGIDQHTRVIDDYITVLGNTSNVLVVNGIAYATYTTQMENFYSSSACFGNNMVDVWDLFGDQCFDYSINSNIHQVNLFNRSIPTSILKLYHKVLWIGNSYGGDEAFYDPEQVISYVQEGGNFLIATREGAEFFDTDLQNYCGITSFSGLLALTELIALDDSLVNISAVGTNDRNQFPQLDVSSEAIPIFDDNVSTNQIAGFRIQKDNEGSFIYIAGRPYRFDNTAMSQNYDYMLSNWLNYSSVAVVSPNGGEVWVVGESEDITWTGVNVSDVKIELSVDNGSNWTSIVESTPNTGTYPWTVTAQDSSDECLIRITNAADGTVFDVSDDVFTIDIVLAVEEILSGIPSEYDLAQNYPNPFNPTTTIQYSVPEESPVSIKIYDLTGSEVVNLVEGVKKAGTYRLTFNAENLASGIYFYHMRAGEFISVKKMSILK
jgi:PKD repeat protein